ncbi:HD domain-containing protein [Gaoshiqia sp. Z1-71]|uniref:HD domain-containing protein n=1 Tax=Gaoshiqia hydrogeniformans TaxID=3290090 RepID=UPI003BF8F3D1
MKKPFYIKETAMYVRLKFEQESSGHDWWHIYRVWKLAVKIGLEEHANLFLVEMAALLHDLDDWKITGQTQEKAQAVSWMEKLGIPQRKVEQIWQIINEVSFQGAGVDTIPTTLEAKVVQDADRLDAIGAIGIARTFAFGGWKNRLIYDPGIKPELHSSFEAYKKTTAPTINHFYEKLLLLKDRMNTETAKEMAQKRHEFMEVYLGQFFNEWNLN